VHDADIIKTALDLAARAINQRPLGHALRHHFFLGVT
jgi:hypothetical protein